jgi:hypothetical protein
MTKRSFKRPHGPQVAIHIGIIHPEYGMSFVDGEVDPELIDLILKDINRDTLNRIGFLFEPFLECACTGMVDHILGESFHSIRIRQMEAETRKRLENYAKRMLEEDQRP